jgi:hypothetical protein
MAEDPSEATWAMIAHLAIVLGPLSFVVPLALLLTLGQRSPFVSDQAAEALNFQITVGLGIVVCLALMLILVGGLILVLWGVVSLGLAVAAAASSYDGRVYRYPVCIRLIR